MLQSWRRQRPNAGRIRSASAAGLSVAGRQAGRIVRRAVEAVGNLPLPGGRGAAAQIPVGVGIAAGAEVLRRAANANRLKSSAGGNVSVSSKKKSGKKKYVKKPKFNKKQRKSIARIAKRGVDTYLGTWQEMGAAQKSSAVNKVSWNGLYGPSYTTYKDYLTSYVLNTAADATTNVFAEEAKDNTTSNKKYKISFVFQQKYKNNTNSVALMKFYEFKAKDATNQDPPTELDNRITNNYGVTVLSAPSTLGTAIAKEDNYFQYWTTGNMHDSQWKIVKQTEVRLTPGEEYDYIAKGSFILDSKEQLTVTYRQNQPYLLMRLCGTPTHDSTTATNKGISNTLLDSMFKITHKVWALGTDSRTIPVNKQIATTGLSAISPVEATPVVVGPYDQLLLIQWINPMD